MNFFPARRPSPARAAPCAWVPTAVWSRLKPMLTAPMLLKKSPSGTGTAMNSTPPLRARLSEQGLIISGRNPESGLVEIIEAPDHPWFLGCQFHPEFKSRPMNAHPLFRDFIAAACRFSRRNPLSMSREVAGKRSPARPYRCAHFRYGRDAAPAEQRSSFPVRAFF